MSAIDWALNAATRFVEQERLRDEQWSRSVQKRLEIMSQAPVLWNKVRQAVQLQVCSFNAQVGRQILSVPIKGNGKLAVYGYTEFGPRTMTLKFDADAPSVVCTVTSGNDKFEFENKYFIDADSGGGGLVARAGDVECSAEEVASQFLNRFMGWN